MKNIKFYICTFFIALLVACSSDDKRSALSTDSEISDRPHDPWIFRSVIDQQARMITMALDKDVWMTYNTQTGAIYKVWKGIVNFEGAVYDHAHGPQPTTVGDAYFNGSIVQPYSISKNGKKVNTAIHYRGHRIVDDEPELMFTLENISAGIKIDVNERIQITEKDGKKYIEWVLTSGEVPDGYQVSRDTEVSSLVSKSQFIRPESFQEAKTTDYEVNGRNLVSIKGSQSLGSNDEQHIMMQVISPSYIDSSLDDGFGDDENLPSGGVLIGKNDCKTCHNKNKKTVGPAYVSIAKKYEHNDASIAMLTTKIKKGATGVWGQQVMTPHPEIPNDDIMAMIEYIFTLADFEGESTTQDAVESYESPSVVISEDDVMVGATTRIYELSKSINGLPNNWSNMKPIMGGIMPNFSNISGNSFVDVEDWFGLHAQGYFHMPEDGIVRMRIWSDDGSRLSINGKVVADNDGFHGTEMKEVELGLTKGYHPFVLEFFQGAGGKFLSWNYKPKGAENWQAVPSDQIFHDKKDHEILNDLSLPMAVVNFIPGNKSELVGVHPSFDLSQARPTNFEPKVGGLDFLDDGRIVVSTWDLKGAVYIVDGVKSGDPSKMTVKRIASGLAEPLGVKVVDGNIYVMQKQEMTQLIDHNGDEIIDEYRTLCDDWGVSANFHEFGFGLEEKDGYLYANLATGILPGGAGMKNQHPDRGSSIRVNIKTGELERVANGLRTPNGVGKGYNNEIFIADNQGDWLPASKIVHVEKGDWFGSRAVDFEGTANFTEKKPVVWLPQNDIGNSPSTPSYLNVGPYKNQMIHGEVTHGGIKRVFVEEVEGQLQGALFRFTQGMEAGVNRIDWGPDGALYVGGIGNPGNWQTNGLKWFGLQRLAYNDQLTFEMLSVKAKSNGLEIEFTDALGLDEGVSIDDYEIKQWYYEPTAEYGGPKLEERELRVLSVNPSSDGRKVFLEIEGMKEDHVVYVRLKGQMISASDQDLWSTECWYTMNKIPKNNPGAKSAIAITYSANALSEKEKAAGWELLFDGTTLNNWKGFNQDEADSKWSAVNGTLYFNPKADGKGGDIMTSGEYENFDLRLEWKNSKMWE